MKIENLCVGMILKSYRNLCEVLEIKPTGGDSKKAQLKELERFVGYHKEGNKFVIDNIYEEIKEKVDNRMLGNNSVYGEELRNLILYILATSDELCDCEKGKKSLTIPRTLLLRKLHMVNSNYAVGRREQSNLAELMCMDACYINEFYNTTHDNLRSSLETSLNQLHNMRLINWQKEMMSCKKQATFEINEVNEIVIDDDFNPKCKIKEVYKPVTDEESAYILRVEKNLLDEYKVKNVTDLYKIGKMNEFHKRANKTIKDNTNILYYFYGYKITFNKDIVVNELDSLGIDVEEIRSIINKKAKEKTLDNAMKRNSIALDEYYSSDRIEDKIKHRIDDDYVANMDLLITILIDIDAKDVRKQIATLKVD